MQLQEMYSRPPKQLGTSLMVQGLHPDAWVQPQPCSISCSRKEAEVGRERTEGVRRGLEGE